MGMGRMNGAFGMLNGKIGINIFAVIGVKPLSALFKERLPNGSDSITLPLVPKVLVLVFLYNARRLDSFSTHGRQVVSMVFIVTTTFITTIRVEPSYVPIRAAMVMFGSAVVGLFTYVPLARCLRTTDNVGDHVPVLVGEGLATVL